MTTSTAIARLNAADPDFAHHLDHLLSWESVSDDSVNQRVLDIIKAVRERGDAALVDFTRQFDGLDVASMSDLILPRERLELALTRITLPQREALKSRRRGAQLPRNRSRIPGATPRPMAPCWAKRSCLWIAPACTYRAVKPRTRRRY